MGQRKKSYIPKAFESTGVLNDTSANIYGSMIESPAFKDLSKNQRLLYVYMKKQYYGTRKPGRDFPDMEQLQGDDLFYFNLALAVKYNLYSRSNKRQFYTDIKALVSHGFIKNMTPENKTILRSVYKFIGEWKMWQDTS